MHKSQFRNIDPRDWFCAPGSRISSSRIYLTDCNQSVNFELLGYLALHYMLFQTSGKKTSKFKFIALYLFVSVEVSSKTSLKVFSPFQQHFQTPNFTVLFMSKFYRSLPMGLFISLTRFYYCTLSLFASIDFKINTHKAFLWKRVCFCTSAALTYTKL